MVSTCRSIAMPHLKQTLHNSSKIHLRSFTTSPYRFTENKPSSTSSASSKIPSLKELNSLVVNASTSPLRAATTSRKQSPAATFRASNAKPPTGEVAIDGYTQQEYNREARRWTAIMVSVPLVLVSSWWVYERLVLKKEKRSTALPSD